MGNQVTQGRDRTTQLPSVLEIVGHAAAVYIDNADPITIEIQGITITDGAAHVRVQDVEGVPAAAADVNVPAVNTAAVVTYGATAGVRHCITGVAWSYYGGIPTGGRLTITDAGATVFDQYIAEEGPGFVVFPRPKCSAAVNTALVVTLSAGGAAVFGSVSVLNHWTE